MTVDESSADRTGRSFASNSPYDVRIVYVAVTCVSNGRGAACLEFWPTGQPSLEREHPRERVLPAARPVGHLIGDEGRPGPRGVNRLGLAPRRGAPLRATRVPLVSRVARAVPCRAVDCSTVGVDGVDPGGLRGVVPPRGRAVDGPWWALVVEYGALVIAAAGLRRGARVARELSPGRRPSPDETMIAPAGPAVSFSWRRRAARRAAR